MPETSINAYFMDVDEAAQKVKQANAEHKAALERLEAKKKAVNWQEPEASNTVEGSADPEIEPADTPSGRFKRR